MLQLAFTGSQSVGDLAQRVSLAQLAEHHRHALAPTAETAAMPFGVMLLDGIHEGGLGNQAQHLREDAAYFIQRGTLLLWSLFCIHSSIASRFHLFFKMLI